MNNILRDCRRAAGMTQENAAEEMNVSTNTIQNWERGRNSMSKEALHMLLDVYGVDQEIRNKAVLEIFGEERSIEDDKKDNFPYFLFEDYPSIIQVARNAVLTSNEAELFEYLYYYGNRQGDGSMDYNFIKDFGGPVAIARKKRLIERRIGYFTPQPCDDPPADDEEYKWSDDDVWHSLAPSLYAYFQLYDIEKGFSFCRADKDYILYHVKDLPEFYMSTLNRDEDINGGRLLEYCKMVENPVMIGTTDTALIPIGAYKVRNSKNRSRSHEDILEGETEQSDPLQKIVNATKAGNHIEYKLILSKFYTQCIELIEKTSEKGSEYWLQLTQKGKEFLAWCGDLAIENNTFTIDAFDRYLLIRV